ncbi:MAG: TerB family tellurite resistance protein [Gammaproteobacteria bacterium]
MLSSLKDWFEARFLVPDEEASSEAMLQQAAAVLLCEIMHADHEVTSAEQAVILESMQSFLGMSPEAARDLYAEVEALMQDALPLQQFTALLNNHYEPEQKQALLTWLWRVVYADGRMDAHEEHLVRRVADLLYIRHADYVRIRNQVCGMK